MATIKKRYKEGEQKIIELNAESVMVKDVLQNAITIANSKEDDIEYKLEINGVKLHFSKGISLDWLHSLYQEKLNQVNII